MKLQILALSTVLLFGAGAFAQTNTTPAANNNGNAVTATQPANPNNNGVNPTPQTVPINNRPIGNSNWYSGSGDWGLWGLLGLFGFFGLARGGRRDEVVRTTTTNLPPR